MSGFVFTPQNADADVPPVEAPDLVKGDGFWPDINITDVRDVVRLDTTITPARLRDAVRQAMLDIAAALADWRAGQEAAGINTLSDVPSRMKVDGVSDYVLRWSRAVYSVVGADLGERLVSQTASTAGVDRAQALGQDVLVHQRNVSFAVRDFLGRPRIRARMI
nr:head completion/stabilization protein [Brevundimonas diminuta]